MKKHTSIIVQCVSLYAYPAVTNDRVVLQYRIYTVVQKKCANFGGL